MEPNQLAQEQTTLPSTPPQPIIPPAPVAYPQQQPSKIPTILLILISLLSLSGLVYFYLQTQSFKQQIIMQTTPTPNSSITTNTQPSPTNNPTTNWETYTNNDLGFIFKHPSGLTVEQVSKSPNEQYKLVSIGEKQKQSGRTQASLFDGYIVNVSNRGKDSVEQIANSTYNGTKQNCPDTATISNITNDVSTLGKTLTYSVVGCMGDYTETFVTNNETTFEITQFYTGNQPEYDQYKNLTSQILSTFQFIDSQ